MIVDGYLAVLIAKKAARAWCWLVLVLACGRAGCQLSQPSSLFCLLQGLHAEIVVVLVPQDGHRACSWNAMLA